MMPSKSSGLPDRRLPACYEAEALIAASDRASVYLARDRNSGKQVAIKQFTAQASQLFMHETNLALAFHHPALLSCEGSFYNELASGYLVFEFISGGTLRERLQRDGKLSVPNALDCVVQVLKGLIEMHKQGWIHGDLKPENIYLRQSPHKGFSYVIGDLGSCRAIKELALGKTAVGTPAYSAPETLFNKQDVRSDLYSLGMMAYELVTGSLPVKSIQDAQKAHLQSSLPLEMIEDSLFRDLVGALVARQPEDRFTDAQTALSMIKSMGFTSWPKHRPRVVCQPNITQSGTLDSIGDCVYELVLRQKPESIHIVNDADQQCTVAFVSQGIVELLTIPGVGECRTLVKQGGVASLPNGELGYHAAGRVTAYHPFTARRREILSVPHKILGMAFNDRHVAWFDSNGYHLYDQLSKQQHVRQVARAQSAAKASIALYRGGWVCTEGMWNREIICYDERAQPYEQLTLPDPVLALAAGQQTVWAITLNTDNGNAYQVWSLTGRGQATLINLTAPLNSWSICGGHLNLLLRDNSLWRLADAGLVKLASSALTKPIMFAVSPDGRFAVVLAHRKATTQILEFHHLPSLGAEP